MEIDHYGDEGPNDAKLLHYYLLGNNFQSNVFLEMCIKSNKFA